MEGNDVVARIYLMKVFSDVLPIPGIPAETEDQGLGRIRRIGRYANSLQSLTVRSCDGQMLRTARAMGRRTEPHARGR